jgi:tetratricopeptide (TPR) repeat protein
MKVAVLPLMPSQGTPAYLGRQIAGFIGDQVRAATGAEINSISYLTQIEDEDGTTRVGFVNFADTFLEPQQIQELFEQTGVDLMMDGQVGQTDSGDFKLIIRYHRTGGAEPKVDERSFGKAELFSNLHALIKQFAQEAELTLPEYLSGDTMEFGTDDPDAFLDFLQGYDGLTYLQQSQGRVVREFSPQIALDSLLRSVERDPDFIAPYEVLAEFCRACVQIRLGTFEMLEHALVRLTELVPEEYRAYFILAELYQAVNNANKAAELYEKALNKRDMMHAQRMKDGEEDETYNQDISALYTRLGMAQIAVGMPVNAERNFRKAVELEGDDKPSLDYLAMVLQQTNREHEIPGLWKEQVDKNGQNPQAHVKYALSLVQAGRAEEGERAFEQALETVEDNTIVKRYYAPVLAQKGDLDRAMDFFEDCIDVAPNDIELLLEYARTLQMASREFEIPKVLRDVLNSNPDPNTRANTLAWLIELEQPKRAENVEKAQEKMIAGDFEGAVRDLKPLRNWLADYWKMWFLLASALNKLGQSQEAEEASRRLLDLFPGFEPGYTQLAEALAEMGKADEAYEVMRFAAANMPQSLPIHLNLALAAKRAGHEDEARSLAKQIREVVGTNEEIEPVLAEIER